MRFLQFAEKVILWGLAAGLIGYAVELAVDAGKDILVKHKDTEVSVITPSAHK